MNPLFVGPIVDLISKGLDRAFPDPAEKAKVQMDLAKMEQEGVFRELDAHLQTNLAQIRVNEAEASSENLFKAGWRPAFGWAGVFVLCSELILRPYLPWLMEVFGFYVPPIPSIDTEMFWPLIFGILGLGGIRTLEKNKAKK